MNPRYLRSHPRFETASGLSLGDLNPLRLSPEVGVRAMVAIKIDCSRTKVFFGPLYLACMKTLPAYRLWWLSSHFEGTALMRCQILGVYY